MAEDPERVNIKKWNAVALWAWEVDVDSCAICKNLIMELCIECQSGQKSSDGGDCTVSWGRCNHAFHTHCIKRWLSTRSACPLDNTEWAYKNKGE